MSFFDDLYCPHCDDDQVTADGPEDSPILLIGAKPGKEEIKYGKPMIGVMGNILRTEIDFLGYDVRDFRITNIWLHDPNGKEECRDHGREVCFKEAKGVERLSCSWVLPQ